MPVLPDGDRAALLASMASTVSSRRDSLALTRAQFRAAVNATDDWLDANAGSFNAALPVAARTTLTGRQKAELLLAVIRRRFEVA